MSRTYKKKKGKSAPYTVGKKEQTKIADIKKRLQYIITNKYADIREQQAVRAVLSLDDYDMNMILGYYELADGSSTKLARYFGVRPNVILTHIHKIIDKLKQYDS